MKKIIWLLLDNRIGSRHQAEGIAAHLNPEQFEVIKKEIKYTKWAALPNFIRGKTLLGITTESKKDLLAPFPDIVLSASRRTAPVARWIKKQNPETDLIQLLHIGRCGADEFTMIFAPEHDKYKYQAPNIRYTTGSPHFVTKERLEEAKLYWQERFSHLPRPITAVIIGGAIKKHPFTLENAETLALQIKKHKELTGGSLLLTTSRRTGLAAEELIISHLKDIPSYNYLWGDKSENPYMGFLACSDDIIVTGDSVSMCCEATATDKPLRIFTGKDWLTPKHQRFVQTLCEKGYASVLENPIKEVKEAHAPLNVAKEIAEIISNLPPQK